MEKLKEIDFLRAFAILAVVIIHLTSDFLVYPKDSSTYITFGILNKSLQFAVPLFIFISSEPWCRMPKKSATSLQPAQIPESLGSEEF